MNKKLLKMQAALFIVALTVTGCSTNAGNYNSKEYFAMDTIINVKAKDADNKDLDDVYALLKNIESVFSRTAETSEISRLNAAEGTENVSDSCADILRKAKEISIDTDGAFNPCIGRLTSLWDVTGKKHVPDENEIQTVLPLIKNDSYTVDDNGNVTKDNPQTAFDLGAAVKGYAAEEAIKLLGEKGFEDAMISIGGNIAVSGNAPESHDGWTVGIINPFFPDSVAGYVICTDTVISVSGDYERFFEKDGVVYHHIFDSSTGYPADSGLKSVAVFAKDGFVSDALSTALFVMGIDKSMQFYKSGLYSFEAVFFDKSGNVYTTDGLKDKFILFEDAVYDDSSKLILAQYK